MIKLTKNEIKKLPYVDDVAFPIDIIKNDDFDAYSQNYIDGILFRDIFSKVKNEEFDISLDDLSRIFEYGRLKLKKIGLI